VVDGPAQNSCPGEAVTPAELFLAGVAACGVELLQVIAREQDLPLRAASVGIFGTIDRSHPVRPDFALFNSVRIQFHTEGSDRRARRPTHRSLQAKVTIVRHGRICDPGCPGWFQH
jgi:uncharacterized OsmC-like protein